MSMETSQGGNDPHDPLGAVKDAHRNNVRLRREVQRLSEALFGLACCAREFSTEAEYTVLEVVEDDFLSALDHAEKVVGDDRFEAGGDSAP